MRPVLLFLFGAHLALLAAEKHSLQYLYTATSGLSNFPQFVTVGIVNGQPFSKYDSNIRRETPSQEWMAKSVGEEYWEQQTQISVVAEKAFINSINVAKERFNQTGGVHTIQRMYGCEWDDQTGATNGFTQYGYDGEDFMILDLKELRYISPVKQGTLTVDKWNINRLHLESDKHYLGTQCIDWLKKYLQYGKSSLEKKVSPQVSLLQKSSSSPVTCHATGFYPSGVTITWMRNGQEHHEDVELGELLPNEDGTFQKTSTITVTPDEWKNNKFSCVVEHQGKTEIGNEIRTNQDPSAPVPIGIIVGVLVSVLLVVIGVAGYMVYKKKNGFKPVSDDDSGSSSSLHNGSDSGSVHSESSNDSTKPIMR
ncbi:class I histocompatibility antigen, F10 alpha chain-like [Garra rufa]|uniref:class I histocompatibility antigen, F10 alpha chain-like n=1 Tax=Garra rufa TaxID=137080 RepID=UPI003CCE754A